MALRDGIKPAQSRHETFQFSNLVNFWIVNVIGIQRSDLDLATNTLILSETTDEQALLTIKTLKFRLHCFRK
jgi:hypothetical protein